MTPQHDNANWRQFGLREITVVGVMIALWAASLGTGHLIYVKGLFTLSWAALLLSVLALYFRPHARSFWGGFALFGLAYYLFQFTDFLDDRTRVSFFSDIIGPSIAKLLPEVGTSESRGGMPYSWFVGTACKIAMILPVAYVGALLSSWWFETKDSRSG